MSARKVFQDSVTPIHAEQGLTMNGLIVNAAKPEHKAEKLTLHFSFKLPADMQAKLEAKVAKGEVVSPAELAKEYIPAAADMEKLSTWLKGEGFEIVPMPGDGASIYARASGNQLEKSLGVKMVRVTRDGVTYTAAQDAPSLPSEVGEAVQAIIGLQPFRHAHKHFRVGPRRTARKGVAPRGAAAAGGAATNSQNGSPYLVGDILKAYNADGLAVTGKGQTIAILIDTLPKDGDLTAFWAANNVPVTLGQIVGIDVQNSGALPAPEGEETLDVSWSSGIAPGANLRIYASGSLDFPSLDMTLDRIISDLAAFPGMRQLSISLGMGEAFMGGGDGEAATQHQKFLKLAAAGVNVFVSSGDAGSNPDNSGHSSTGPTQAEYSASDSCVIGVGGTTLSINPDGTVGSEIGWASGGGGQSIFFDRPVWQTGNGVPSGSHRLIPDVSLTADPNDGAFLILNGQPYPSPGQGIGGTSWSAPVWAGFCALINEARLKAGKPALPFLNPLIYPLLGTAAFRDIVQGSNGAFTAGPGYDLVTGLGVPNVAALIKALTS